MESGGEQSVALTTVALSVAGEQPLAVNPAIAAPGATTVGAPLQTAGSFAERCFDVTLTILLLPVIALVGALIAIAIYIDSPGPVIYRSWRIGRAGVPFPMLKFRKMRADAGNHPLTVADDERFTPIGRFLATTRLDELPQVWNVLRGEMRLVGPRPEVEYFVSDFAEQYAEILTVTPGITGIAQLQYVGEQAFLDGPDPATAYRDLVLPEKIKIDLAYARSRSLAGDVRILAQTLALPFRLALTRVGSNIHSIRVWLPTAASALLLVLMFVVASSHIS